MTKTNNENINPIVNRNKNRISLYLFAADGTASSLKVIVKSNGKNRFVLAELVHAKSKTISEIQLQMFELAKFFSDHYKNFIWQVPFGRVRFLYCAPIPKDHVATERERQALILEK